MDLFDSLCQAMTTMSTGGFSTRNLSIGYWESPYIAVVVSVFMVLGGVNFILLYNLLSSGRINVLNNGIFKAFIAVVVVMTVVMSISLIFCSDMALGNVIISAFFHVASAVTSTGFTYSGFSSCGDFAVIMTVLLMICGACAGSTSGGVKIDRVYVIVRNIKGEIIHTLFPKRIKSITICGKSVDEAVLSRIFAFLSLYISLILAGTLLMAAYGYSFIDSLFASASCIGNNGLGFGATGSGFGLLPDTVKWLLTFLMLVGRLEIFTVLVLLYPAFWKR